jgi:hypothetical protein
MIRPSGRRRWPRRAPVTVCIAATADHGERVVLTCDTRVSTATTSLDPVVGRKMMGVRGWTALVSGSLCYAESLLDTIMDLMQHASDNDPPTVRDCLQRALLIELPRYSAARYLTPYGIDMPTFLGSGSTMFTNERKDELGRLILEYSDTYDVELIMCGWGVTQEQMVYAAGSGPDPCIYSVSRDGVTTHADEGFYTCGLGKESAHSILSFFNCQSHMALAEVVYYAAGAKFMSERTAGVGPNTLIRIAERTGRGDWRGYFLQEPAIRELRRLWTNGAPRLPRSAIRRIRQLLN